jgi:hypothetical protein
MDNPRWICNELTVGWALFKGNPLTNVKSRSHVGHFDREVHDTYEFEIYLWLQMENCNCLRCQLYLPTLHF